jgi:Rrf2 family protein
MKFTAQEELGLRCMVRMAQAPRGGALSIAEIARQEALTAAYVAKLMRLLRLAELVTSVRGQKGGYKLTTSPEEISVGDVLAALGEPFHSADSCRRRRGRSHCVHIKDCPIRPLWVGIDQLAQRLLSECTLAELLSDEAKITRKVKRLVDRLAH